MGNIAEMPKYESYKDSGRKWLGLIPKHWYAVKFKYLASIKKGKVPKKVVSENNADLPPYLSMEYLRGGNASQFVVDRDATVIDEGCILLLWDGSNAGEFVRGKRGVVSSTLASVEFSKLNSQFAWYACQITEMELRVTTVGMGIPHVDGDQLKNSFLAIPYQIEQELIVKYLDKKTSQIDEAIYIKEQQISLLKERKKIIIQQSVTQGLDLSVPMKDSGIDWIGNIPEHWEIVRFKNLFSQSRLPVRKEDEVVTSYRDGQVTLRSNRRLEGYTEAILEGGYQGIRQGQLVLNSMDAFEGAIGVSDSDGKCTPEYVICDPKRVDISPYYFALLLREMALSKYIQVICNAVRQRAVRIRFNNLATRFMIVPPKSEQDAIIHHIETETSKIDVAVEQLNYQINKLKEFKITLINRAVTGKIKITPEMVEDE